jgi:hypothetical protein
MKSKQLVAATFILSLMIAALSVASWAQSGGGQGRGQGMHYGTMWDAKTVETVKGEVVAVDKFTPGRGGNSYGLHLTLKTDTGTLPVILGPGWYIEQQHFVINPGDKAEISGSRMEIKGQAKMIAASVNIDGKILKLRNDNGTPVWTGPR